MTAYKGFHNVPDQLLDRGSIARRLEEVADGVGLGMPWSVNPQLATSTTNVGVANRTQYFRVFGRAPINSLTIYVAVSSGNICLSVHKKAGVGASAYPATRVATTGSIACPAAGRQVIALPSTLVVGPDHWFAISADNTTATFNSCPTTTNLTDGIHGFADVAFPTPASYSGTLTVSNRLICMIGTLV